MKKFFNSLLSVVIGGSLFWSIYALWNHFELTEEDILMVMLGLLGTFVGIGFAFLAGDFVRYLCGFPVAGNYVTDESDE